MEAVTNTVKNAIYGNQTNVDKTSNPPTARVQRSDVGGQPARPPEVTSDAAADDSPSSGGKYSVREESTPMRHELSRDAASRRGEQAISEDASDKDLAGAFRSYPAPTSVSGHAARDMQNLDPSRNEDSADSPKVMGDRLNAESSEATRTEDKPSSDSPAPAASGAGTERNASAEGPPPTSRGQSTKSVEPPLTDHTSSSPEPPTTHTPSSSSKHSTASSTYHTSHSLTSNEPGPPGPVGGFRTDSPKETFGESPAAPNSPLPPSCKPGVGDPGTSREPQSALEGVHAGSGPAAVVEPSVSAPPRPDDQPSSKHQGEHQPLARPNSRGADQHPQGPTGLEVPTGMPNPMDRTTGEGSGKKYERSTGMAADGGDFDAVRPGAGKEADRLLDEQGVSHGGKPGEHHSPQASGKQSVGQKIKEKLHLKKH